MSNEVMPSHSTEKTLQDLAATHPGAVLNSNHTHIGLGFLT